ncbi:ComF family protein [Sulfurimonas sp. NW7]|uniref:ComF family protein n=1 Tax=Sulfurimonas sp. NW7 TaxID=2922727 RepID=UPI003DA872D0
MKCIVCESYAFTHICSACQTNFLSPALYRRKLPNGTDILSFYKYEEIKELLFTKHTDIGFYIYTILAKLSFKKFAKEFHTKEKYISLAIDDKSTSGYSHTALLNHALKTYNIRPLYNKLRAQNSVSYSGKSKQFRQENPRNFQLKKFKDDESIILVDDIVTTGQTLAQACTKVEEQGQTVSFCLTLTDVSLK